MTDTDGHVERAYRLVAADLDGTLLGPDGELSGRAMRAAQALHAARIPLVLATSRRMTGASPVAQLLNFPLWLILYDGAVARTWPEGAELFRDALDAETGQQVVEILSAHGLRPIVQHNSPRGEHLRVGPRVSRNRQADAYLALYHHQAQEATIAKLSRGHADPLRIVAFGERRRLRAAARDLAGLPCGWQLLTAGSYGTSELTVFSVTASKANALARLSAHVGIAMEQIVAIGDGINDVTMLAAAGLGVAMANGSRSARRAADVIAPPHVADGAAWAIERYVLRWDADNEPPDEPGESRAS